MIRSFQGLGLRRRRGSAAPTGHAYWRVKITDNHGSASFIGIAEIEFRATPGGADQASGGSVVYSTQAGGSEATKAFDDNNATYWTTASGSITNQYIGYHFASPVAVEEVALRTINVSSLLTLCPKNCAVEYSDDGSSWTEAYTFTLNCPLINHVRAFPEAAPGAGFHRAWRIFCLNNNGGSSFITLLEIEMRASTGGADQAANVGSTGSNSGRAIFSTQLGSGNEAYRCFDDVVTGANYWASSGVTNQYVGFVFPDAVKVEEIRLVGSSLTTRNPNDIQVEYSDDLVTWTNQKSINDLTWTSEESKVLAAI